MENEKKLASPNFGSAIAGAVGVAGMANAAKTGPKWLRYLMFGFIGIVVLVTGLGLVEKLSNISSIPACDAQRTRDTLSDLNKENKFDATKYNFIKNVSTSEGSVTCTANLALKGGATVEYDYRIFKNDAQVMVQITDIRR